MFADGWDSVTASDVADAADVSHPDRAQPVPVRPGGGGPHLRAPPARTDHHGEGADRRRPARRPRRDVLSGWPRTPPTTRSRHAPCSPNGSAPCCTTVGPAPRTTSASRSPSLFALLPALERLDLGDAEPVDLGLHHPQHRAGARDPPARPGGRDRGAGAAPPAPTPPAMGRRPGDPPANLTTRQIDSRQPATQPADRARARGTETHGHHTAPAIEGWFTMPPEGTDEPRA